MSTTISRINSSRSGCSSGSAGSCECVGMEEDRDGGSRKGRVCVTNPIPIVRGKMKKRGLNISARVAKGELVREFFFSFLSLILELWDCSFFFLVFLLFSFPQTT